MMLLLFSLLVCGSDVVQEGIEGGMSQVFVVLVEVEVLFVEDVSLVLLDYEFVFFQVEVKKWYLIEYVYDGWSVKMGKEDIFMIIIVNGKIFGYSGCNKFSFIIIFQEDGIFNIGELVFMKMFCQGKMIQEFCFFDLLKFVNVYSVNKVFLEILGGQG